jgi:hypothetical protein
MTKICTYRQKVTGARLAATVYGKQIPVDGAPPGTPLTWSQMRTRFCSSAYFRTAQWHRLDNSNPATPATPATPTPPSRTPTPPPPVPLGTTYNWTSAIWATVTSATDGAAAASACGPRFPGYLYFVSVKFTLSPGPAFYLVDWPILDNSGVSSMESLPGCYASKVPFGPLSAMVIEIQPNSYPPLDMVYFAL